MFIKFLEIGMQGKVVVSWLPILYLKLKGKGLGFNVPPSLFSLSIEGSRGLHDFESQQGDEQNTFVGGIGCTIQRWII